LEEKLAVAQSLKYAEELRELYGAERAQRRIAEDALARLEASYRTTVRALAAALELRDDQTGAHAERVTELALRLAERVAPELVSDRELEYGFLLHDLGKIGVPDALVLKPGPLDEDEMETMRRHVELGEQIVARIPYLGGLARQVIAGHHERWDGRGYPRELAGEDIPLPARIFAVVDTFDAMTNDRPYRQALPVEDALAEIRAGAGTQFDPDIVRAFTDLVKQLDAVA
jgi:HD-GYP domain-containing protein (c-di-GMP phosphodiesterase class II)